ncbi:Mitoferrin-2 [Thelohanellus kitauei]|nr:Mitoferrin-2 [Thelohanellus kitauei]
MVMNPMEVMKQRLQMCSQRYIGLVDCIKKVVSTEGPVAFYRSFPAQFLMNFPFNSANFITYEYTKKLLGEKDEYRLVVHLVSGAISGIVASSITTPFDVMKTTLNLQDPKLIEIFKSCQDKGCSVKMKDIKIRGIFDSGKTIYLVSGLRGFFRGVVARILISAPSGAISWGVYETFKYLLG